MRDRISMENVKVAFVGQVAPYTKEFYSQPGYGRPGSLAQLGFIEALHLSEAGLDCAWGFRPIAHWPKTKIQFEWTRHEILPCGAKITLVPLLNHFILREISRYFILTWFVITWALRRIGCRRVLVTYNLTQPNGICLLRILTWLTRTRLVPIVYDLAKITTFRKSLHFRIVEPDWLDRVHEKTLRFCDGLIPITDAIARDFAPALKYLRVDGGIGDSVVQNLPPITSRKENGSLVLFYAGSMDAWNGISLMLEYFRKNPQKDLRLFLAGGGCEESQVKDAALHDPRIIYFGFVGPEKLQELYSQADILLNIRDIVDPGLKYHYPSKTFEMLAIGRPLIASNSSHTKAEYGKYCKVMDSCTLEAFDDAINFFIQMSPDERCEYGKRAREFALSERSWKSWGSKIGPYIRDIAFRGGKCNE